MLGTEVFWKKNAKKVMKNHKLKPPTFTLIMLSSIQPVKIPEKITVFFKYDGCLSKSWTFAIIQDFESGIL